MASADLGWQVALIQTFIGFGTIVANLLISERRIKHEVDLAIRARDNNRDNSDWQKLNDILSRLPEYNNIAQEIAWEKATVEGDSVTLVSPDDSVPENDVKVIKVYLASFDSSSSLLSQPCRVTLKALKADLDQLEHAIAIAIANAGPGQKGFTFIQKMNYVRKGYAFCTCYRDSIAKAMSVCR